MYKRIANDKWTKVAEIKNIFNRVFVIQVEGVKTYEFVVPQLINMAKALSLKRT